MKKVTNTSVNPRIDWLGGGNPKAIENQEAEGQKEFVVSDQLPQRINDRNPIPAKERYEKLGIKVLGETVGDKLFFDVILPEGWKKQPTEHSMWSLLINNNGITIASIFYKAAFYDRDAFTNIE
jgi:hypothetical protein